MSSLVSIVSAAPRQRGLALTSTLALLGGLLASACLAGPVPRAAWAQGAPAPTPTVVAPGTAAPPQVVRELHAALAQGLQRFEAKDLAGVLASVSDQYWTGPLNKATLQAQLVAVFHVYQQVRARVRIDEVRMVGEHAWVYSTGEISGELPFVNQWATLFSWERELEVARRENGVWRLFGYQQ